MRLGILDFCQVRRGEPPYKGLHETIHVAQQADALGYSRFWLAEHHEINYAQHVPDLMSALVAGSTERIRVGAAGMLLKLHSPMRVAKTFRTIAAMFPGRIDLGMAGGEAEPAVVEAMLNHAQPLEEVRKQYLPSVRQLVELMRGQSPLHFNPMGTPPPPMWLLGMSNPITARLAAELGISYGFSLAHVQSKENPAVCSVYLDEFRPSAQLATPELVVAVSGMCAETEEEAMRLARPGLGKMDLELTVIGTPAQCREKLEAICHRYRTQELVFLDYAPDMASRLRCYQLLASALSLGSTGDSLKNTNPSENAA